MDAAEIELKVRAGETLPLPTSLETSTRKTISEIYLQCKHMEPNKRPNFVEICEKLQEAGEILEYF